MKIIKIFYFGRMRVFNLNFENLVILEIELFVNSGWLGWLRLAWPELDWIGLDWR